MDSFLREIEPARLRVGRLGRSECGALRFAPGSTARLASRAGSLGEQESAGTLLSEAKGCRIMSAAAYPPAALPASLPA